MKLLSITQVIALTTLLACTARQPVLASVQIAICNHCYNSTDFSSVAVSTAAGAPGAIVNVINPKSGAIEKHKLLSEHQPSFGLIATGSTEQVSISSQEYQWAQDVKNAYTEVDALLDQHLVLPNNLLPGDWTVMNIRQVNFDIEQHLNRILLPSAAWSKLKSTVPAYTAKITQFIFNKNFREPKTGLTFMLVATGAPSTQYAVNTKIIRVFDSAGNDLPLTAAEMRQLAAKFTFTAPSEQQMYVLAQLFGGLGVSTLNFTPSSWGGGGTVTIRDCLPGNCNRPK